MGGATAQAGHLAVEAGGVVSGSEESGRPDDRRSTVTLKVPGDRFDRLVGADLLGAHLAEGPEDVTDQVVDLEARRSIDSISAVRLATSVSTPTMSATVADRAISCCNRSAAVLPARLRVLRGRVDLATVTVDLSRPQPAADDELPGFVAGLRGGWRALRATANVGSAVVGALLPWLVPAVLLLLAARLRWRRWRRAHPPRPRPVPAPAWGYGAGSPPAPAPPADPPAPVDTPS